jgi:hypothetical protein
MSDLNKRANWGTRGIIVSAGLFGFSLRPISSAYYAMQPK